MKEIIEEIYKQAKEKGIETEPLDIVRVAKEIFGLRLFYRNLGFGVSYQIERQSPTELFLFVNSNESPLRQRFSIAHALGNIVKRDKRLLRGDIVEQILFRA